MLIENRTISNGDIKGLSITLKNSNLQGNISLVAKERIVFKAGTVISRGTELSAKIGEVSDTKIDTEIRNPFRYSGEYTDDESGLQYLRARYYSLEIRRFITEDTYKGDINSPLSLNYYAYCSGNPIMYIDPSGHTPGHINDGEYYKQVAEKVAGDQANRETTNSYHSFLNENLGANDVGRFSQSMTNKFVESGNYFYGALALATAWWTPETADKTLASFAIEGLTTFIGTTGKNLYKGTTVVIGHYPEYVEVGEGMNAKLFSLKEEVWKDMEKNFSDEIWVENRKFLDNVMKNNDNVILATPPNKIRSNSYLDREMHYFMEKGYDVKYLGK